MHQVDHLPDDRVRGPVQELRVAEDRAGIAQPLRDLNGVLAIPDSSRGAPASARWMSAIPMATMIAQLNNAV